MKTNPLAFIAAAFALSSSLLLPGNAAARDWGYVGGWYVTSADKSCGMYAPQVRPQSAEMLILKRLDGAIYVQAKNAAWAIAPGSEDLIQYQIDGRTYRGAQKTAAASGGGIGGGTGNGLLAAFGGDFENELRSGSTLTILNNGRQVEQIPLTGTSAALATITSCLEDLRANGNAPAAGFASLAASSVSPKGDVSRWISIDDYPSAALREGREGIVGFRLSVGNDGRVLGCTITKSSGHADLDTATCNGVTKRARFDPAKDASGAKVGGSYQSRVSWKLPN